MKKRNSIIALALSVITIASMQTSFALKVYYNPPATPKAAPPIELSNRQDFSDVETCKLKNTIFDENKRLAFPLGPYFAPSVGNRKAITLFADFSDYPSDKNHKNLMLDFQEPRTEEFYYDASYGKYNLKFDHIEKIYHFGSHLNYSQGNFMSGNRFINEVMAAADNDVDFSKYDFVNIVTPSGYKYDSGAYGMQGTYDGKYFNYALLGTAAMGVDNGRGLEPWLVHETGHMLGTIHPTNDWSPYIWDVSGNAIAMAPDFYAWTKFVLGWIDNSQIDCIGSTDKVKTTHLVSPLGSNSGGSKAVIIKINSHYAVVIENRTKNKIDKNLPSSEEGVLAYTVDINKTGGPNNQCISLVYSADSSNSGTIQVGESLVVEGYKIDVLQKQKSGYIISVTKK